MQRFKQILAVIDLAHPPQGVLERAVSLAQSNQADLSVVCVAPELNAGKVLPESVPLSSQLQSATEATAQQQLEEAVAPYQSQLSIKTSVLVGIPFLEIIRKVLQNQHDLVIKAPENPEWLERVFGSDDMHLLRKCPCPVWLVKDASSESYRNILAAVDVNADHPVPELSIRHALNIQILEIAASLALAEFAQLHVAHAWQAIGEHAMRGPFLSRPAVEVDEYVAQVRDLHEQDLKKLLQEVLGSGNTTTGQFLKPQVHLLKGLARQEIPGLVNRLGVDLVVMGTVARTGVPGLFIGNTAETILEQIGCSVLAIKPAGFVTPVTLQ